MLETLRKLMYIGLGAAAMSRDKVKQTIDEMVDRGEVSAEEGRKLYDDWMKRAEEQGRDLNDRIKAQVRQYLTDAGVADKSQIETLARRIDALEYRIDQLVTAVDAGQPVSGQMVTQSEKLKAGVEPEQGEVT